MITVEGIEYIRKDVALVNVQTDALREKAVKRSIPNAGLHGKPEISTGH